VPRILDLLRRHEAPATFFMPAVSALLHDGEIKSYVDNGHEVALHGWIHERNTMLEGADERELAFRAADVLERLAGTRPVGIRTPSWDFSASTLAITRELGLRYDSSLMADDEPYELLADGEPTGIVELPVEWIRDDAPYFMMERFASLRPYTPPRGVLSIWRDEFDVARAEGGVFQLTMHPHIIGHRSRIAMLSELLDHIGSHSDVWFATHAEVVDHVLAADQETR
jgi:peptidoglycan/xylan/chitin deacetylase (PgdA/CDA1 family)